MTDGINHSSDVPANKQLGPVGVLRFVRTR